MPESEPTVTLTCGECGTPYTVTGVSKEQYMDWIMSNTDQSLAESFPNLSPVHHDQLITNLCNVCLFNKWG